MNKKEFIEACGELGLTQVGLGRLFGTTAKTIYRWEIGEQKVPRAVAIALTLMIKYHVSPAKVSEMAGYKVKDSDFAIIREDRLRFVV